MSIEKKVVEITNHTYQPKHEILSKSQAEEILKKYNTKPSQLPYIMINDKGIVDLDVRPGDIIKITRKSATAGESVYYRYVVEAWFIMMWPIINDVLRRDGIARQHLNSYNEFMERGLQSIIDEVGEIEIETAEYPYKIKLGKIKLQQPRIMELDGSLTHVAPMEARLRNLTYASPIMLEW
jgi:DNA-directed RNA polymerase subunit H (RpoH/RPB5)